MSRISAISCVTESVAILASAGIAEETEILRGMSKSVYPLRPDKRMAGGQYAGGHRGSGIRSSRQRYLYLAACDVETQEAQETQPIRSVICSGVNEYKS